MRLYALERVGIALRHEGRGREQEASINQVSIEHS